MLNEILRLCAIFATTFEGFSIFTSNELFQDLIFTPPEHLSNALPQGRKDIIITTK